MVDQTSQTKPRRRNRVLLVAPRLVATFTRQDLRILQTEFEAVLFPFQGLSSLPALRHEIKAADVVVIWFAGRHAAPAVWFAGRAGIPVVTIVGGYEAAWVPEIGYGIPPRSLHARIINWVLKHSAQVFSVSLDSDRDLKRHYPNVAGKVRLIYNAVDTSVYRTQMTSQRHGVLSVGSIASGTLANKGWTLFWQTAAAMPDISFIAVGPVADQAGRDMVSHCLPNLSWLGELRGDDLLCQYQMASVYFQGSVHESFSLATAEAMSCGCIPVVSHNGALPEVVGDAGFYLDDLSVPSAVKAIREALNAPPEGRHTARQRIVDNFDVEQRRLALCALVHEVIQTNPVHNR